MATTHRLRLVTFNRGDHAGAKDIAEILEGQDAAALQEVYDQQPALDQLEAWGWGVARFPGTSGAAANPVVWNRETMTVVHEWVVPLLASATRNGKHNMAKNLVAVRLRHRASRRLVIVGSVHNIQTQGLPARRVAATTMIDNLVSAMTRRKAPAFVGGDYNAEHDDPSLRPLRAAKDWHCDQQAADKLDTHGKRAIDMWWWRATPEQGVRFVSHRVNRDSPSDHRPLYGEWHLRPVE